MAKYYSRPLKHYKPGQETISARDLEDIRNRLGRLENLKGVGGIQVKNSISGFHILSTISPKASEYHLVSLDEHVFTDRNKKFKGHPIILNTDGGFYSAETEPHLDKVYPFTIDTSEALYFRNPFYFSAEYLDWGFIAKFPDLNNDYMLIQIMCPGVSSADDSDPDDGHNPWTFYSSATPAASGYSARYRIPIALIPGILNSDAD